jgi:hypothetical protein
MSRIKPVIFLCALALFAAPAFAGPLAVDTNALAGFHGSTGYQGYYDFPGTSNPSGLTGHIDYAVYTAANYPAGFTGYVPTPGEYVYTYQIFEHVDGPAPLSQLILTIENAANNPGTFTGNGGFGNVAPTNPVDDVPSNINLVGLDSIQWSFFNGVQAGHATIGLAFSSPNRPELLNGVVIDHGTVGFVIPLPSPGGPIIPEPSTLALASLGFVAFGLRWLRGRKMQG